MTDPVGTSRAAAQDALAKAEILYRLDWERSYPQNVERVWIAISDQDEVSAWMRYPTRLDMRVGGVIHIDFNSQGSLEGIVCELESPRLLTYTWGDSLVKWTLEENAAGTHLHLCHFGVRPDLATGLGAGWHGFLDQLADHLLGNSHPNRYRELKARYDHELKPQPPEHSVDL